MAIPGVSVSVIDGALGLVPASTSQVQVKMGTCANATASVAASVLVPSTTMSDGVTFTAVAAGAAGNLINVTYVSGNSVQAPTITVVGNAITVKFKSATTLNSDVVTAISGSTAASALVSAVATGPSDLVIAASQTFLAGGITGTINSLFVETSPTQALTDLGYGPLTEAVAHSLNVAGGVVLAMPLATSNASTTSAVAHSGSGLGTVAVSGTPKDYYQAQVSITLAGVLGVGQFKYSLDNGQTFSQVYAIPSGGTFAVPNTGLTLTFANGGGSFSLGDVYAFQTTPAGSTISDITAGLNALFALPNTWGWVHIVAPASTSAGAAALAAAVETLMEGAASNFRYAFAVIENPDDTDASIESAFASTSCLRVMVCAGSELLLSQLLGDQPIRNCAWPVTARMALTPPSEDPGRVLRGALPGIVSLRRDENATPALDALDFTTLRTIPGLAGFYVTSGHMFVAPTSDFSLSQNRRVMDVACTVGRQALLNFLNSTIRVNKSTGTISNADATSIENFVNGALGAALVTPGDAVAASILINRTNNVLSSKQILYEVRVTPNGYAKQITGNFAFLNPALQPQ